MVLKKSLIVLVIFAVVFVSGCTETEAGIFGGSCVSAGICTREVKGPEVKDIISIEEPIKVIPAPEGRVRPGSQFNVIVYLKNNDRNTQNKPTTIEWVGISDLNNFQCIKCEEKNIELVPGQVKGVTFTLKAGDNTGTMAITSIFEVSAKYRSTSWRTTQIPVVEKQVYIDYLNSEAKMPLYITNINSDAPVELKIDDSKIEPPILYDDSSKDTRYLLYLEVINAGSGQIDSISAGKLSLKFEGSSSGGQYAAATFNYCDDDFGGGGGSQSGDGGSSSGTSGVGGDCSSVCSQKGYSDGTCSSSPISGWTSVGSCGTGNTKTCYCKPGSGSGTSSPGTSGTGSAATGSSSNACSGKSEISNTNDIRVLGQVPKKYYFDFTVGKPPSKDMQNYIKLTTTAEYVYRVIKTKEILISPRAEV